MTAGPRSRRAPLVSVCMPAYNATPLIGEAIESALAQTWEDFELIVCDDASTDSTLSVARSYADRRLRVEANRARLGKAKNQNRTIELSSGHYVKFLHADDKITPTCLEEMVALAREDDRIGLVFARREIEFEGDGDPAWYRKYARPHEQFEGLARINDGRELFKQFVRGGLEDNWIGEPSAVMVTRQALRGSGVFSERIHQIEDLDLWLRILLENRVGFVDHSLCVYRRHGRSQTASNQRISRDWLDRLWLLDGLLGRPIDPDDRDEIKRLRRAALRRAARSQLGRIARGRLDVQLPFYLAHRALARTGRGRAATSA